MSSQNMITGGNAIGARDWIVDIESKVKTGREDSGSPIYTWTTLYANVFANRRYSLIHKSLDGDRLNTKTRVTALIPYFSGLKKHGEYRIKDIEDGLYYRIRGFRVVGRNHLLEVELELIQGNEQE